MRKLTNDQHSVFRACKAIVCDLDGTLYLDDRALPGAKEFLLQTLHSGKQLYYFTNNTSASRRTWLDKLAHFGFPVTNENLITSADCTISYLKRHNLFPNIYLIGNKDLTGDFQAQGFQCLTPKQALKKNPSAVVLSFDTELTYEKIRTGYELIKRNIPYIATHGDLLCPVGPNSFKPDIGSFIALFAAATGGREPKQMGKPSEEAVRHICELAKSETRNIAFIGDRLYTDIRMAEKSGMVSVLVLTGETTPEMVQTSSDHPFIVVDSLADLINYF